MGEVLTTFGNAFSASLLLAAPAAVAWGVLSVMLSPCHLSSVPLVVAYMGGGAEMPTGRRALAISSAFAIGSLASIAGDRRGHGGRRSDARRCRTGGKLGARGRIRRWWG